MSSKDQKGGERVSSGFPDAKALKLRAIRDAIEAHACDPAFCARNVAEELSVSERYVRRLLQADGDRFSEARKRVRLDRAHALLTDASCASLSVTEVSLASGFTDVSYFNRSFRQRFRVTPTSLRAQKADKD